ncbi:MAG: hypothetical protein JL56_07560 [Desulfotomaculum sp. BICA1-6]|nr:MAG: hypothetical protein JL56_07560 [Desulfotomaculum sp. BICA1-6]
MSNLGWYKTLTTTAKAVGGPKRLLGLILASGAAVGIGGTILTQKAVKVVKNKINKKNTHYIENGKIFVVCTEGMDSDGLVFKVGNKYRILDRDGDSILIEKFGDDDNPYFVSAEFLKKVSVFIPDA